MNNNDPMKRFGYIVFSICLFALSACTPHEQMDQEEGIVKSCQRLSAGFSHTIFLCSILGVWLGNLTGINWLMIPFFFMGALAGFTNIYKTVRKLYRQEEKKENHVKKD